MLDIILQVLGIVLIVVAGFVIYRQHNIIDDLTSKKKSLSSKYGKMTEQFFPFLEKYPYEKNNFRFIGSPIDGIQFEDNKVIFVEFKTATSRMTTKQKKICDLVNSGKVEFREFKINI
jgi:predicted Holliday junction resolvase-like endonuclease